MAPRHAESWHPGHVQRFLHERGLTHLTARKHGSAVIVESGPTDQLTKHFRCRRDTVHLWWLDFADHKGRWERTPFRSTLDDLLTAVVEQFPWTVAPVHDINPERTSDPQN